MEDRKRQLVGGEGKGAHAPATDPTPHQRDFEESGEGFSK